MPYLTGSEPEDPSAQKWHTALKGALGRRLSPEQLRSPLRELSRKYALSGAKVAQILVGFRATTAGQDDPLLFRYAHILLRDRCVGTSDLLLALLRCSRYSNGIPEPHANGQVPVLPTCEERMFGLLTELHMTGAVSIGSSDAHSITFALSRWMHVVYESEYNQQVESAGLNTLDTSAYSTYEALASLVVAISSKQEFREVSKQSWWKQRRQLVVKEMRNFDMHILQWMQSSRSGHLQALTKLPPFVELDGEGRPVLGVEQMLESLNHEGVVPTAQSRAGLYVWLNACFSTRPMTDDLSMLGYLQTRYSGDNQTLTVQYLHAAFDVLTNVMLRSDTSHELECVRSFICNKMPLQLAMLASFTGQMAMETCVQTAFLSIAMDPIPPISAGSSKATEVLKRTRLEFLQSCALHGFVSEATIGAVLQEPPITLPKLAKYSKEGLLAQCTTNVGRLEALVGELQSMQGNAGAVATCIVDLIGLLCANKDTMSLKTACNILIRRVPDFDIVLQYTQPSALLVPLCMLLKDSIHDQDQMEFTPAYEEFASILLLTLALLHRYDLRATDLGLGGSDVFVFQVLDQVSSSKPLTDLSEEQSMQLSTWLDGLFATDEQAIGDDVMRQCPPQAFYVLVPTLFEQSVAACKSGNLPISTFKGGLELLLEPFLLPALVGGLSWVARHSWEDHGDAEILLQVLDKLLKPSTSSADTLSMHKAVLAVVAGPLKQPLQELLRKRPDKTAVSDLIALLKPYADSARLSSSVKAELDQWTSTETGEIEHHLRTKVRDLVAWASNVSPNAPPSYTHRAVLAASRLVGPAKVLQALAMELRDTGYPNASVAMDVCTAMICAPAVEVQTLRAQLALELADTQTLLATSVSMATTLMRLSRSVEAQLAAHQVDMPFALPQAQATTTDQMLQDLGLADAAAASGVGGVEQLSEPTGQPAQLSDVDLQAALNQPLDLTAAVAEDMPGLGPDGGMQLDQAQDFFAELNMDMSQQPGSQMVPQGVDMSTGGPQNTEEDIFAGLDMMGDDFDFT